MTLDKTLSRVWKLVRILFFTFLLLRILGIDVSASTSTTDITPLTIPGYCGSTSPQTGYCGLLTTSSSASVYQLNTLYNGKLFAFGFRTNYGFYTGIDTIIDVYANGNDFRNNNTTGSVVDANGNVIPSTFTFVSRTHLQISFILSNSHVTPLSIYFSSGSAITGDTNWRINRISVTNSTGDNSDIINNSNQNTSEIINNANANAEQTINAINDLISGGVQNMLDQLNQQRQEVANTCKNIIYTKLSKGKRIATDGTTLIDDPNSYYTSDYYYLFGKGQTSRIQIINPAQSVSGYYTIIYDANYNVLSYDRTANRGMNLPNGATWVRFSTTDSTTMISISGSNCLTSEDQVNEYLQDNSDATLNNTGIDNVLGGVQFTDPLSYLLTLPLHLVQRINTLLSQNSCDAMSFGELYGTEIYLPCVDISDYLGSTLYTTIDIIVGVGLLVVVISKLYFSVANITTLGKEKEVRQRLELPTPMDFLKMILGGDS